jgi:hypothetical protein
VTAELSVRKGRAFSFSFALPFLALSFFLCSTERTTHDAVNDHGIRRGTKQWRRVFAQHGAAAAADRHRTSAGQTGEQRTQGGDELQELPQAQGSHCCWKTETSSTFADSECKIKCNRLKPTCEACQAFNCACIYGGSCIIYHVSQRLLFAKDVLTGYSRCYAEETRSQDRRVGSIAQAGKRPGETTKR